MADDRIKCARRALILAASAAMAGWNFPTIGAAYARQKLSKREAEYQDSPKDIRMCATCTLFEPPNSCQLVEGEVTPTGWCKVFALAD
jgi:hypothetical protein